ncbi:MAG TPA: hypothetical protein VF753_19930 [Terriglobales bacterium]
MLRRLDLYALAASAAGVSLFAVGPVEAEVVYTKTHQVIGYYGIYDLDVNHDGAVDFAIQEIGYLTSSTFRFTSRRSLFAKPALGNAIAGTGKSASALKPGANIGPTGHFIDGGSNGAPMATVSVFSRNSHHYYDTRGEWAAVNDRYLGLRFKIKGELHYGWARFSVQTGHKNVTCTLTGYAYETVPNRSIQAGQTGAPIADSVGAGAMRRSAYTSGAELGKLAFGALTLPLRGSHDTD